MIEFLIGFFIGANLGFLLSALIIGARITKDETNYYKEKENQNEST